MVVTQNKAITSIFVIFIATSIGKYLGQARIHIKDQTLSMEQRYQSWMLEQGRTPDTVADAARFAIFKKNAEFVDRINSEDKRFKVALNKWADITNEEFKTGLGYKPYNATKGPARSPLLKTIKPDEAQQIPARVDWRDGEAVTYVRNQGTCGACWAFAAVAVLESMTKIVQGLLLELSEQHLIDCDTEINRGCNGGSVLRAYDFILKNDGITSEKEYPYKGFNEGGVCRKNDEFLIMATIYGFAIVAPNDETALMQAVARQPVAVAIDAACDAFRLYSGGILTEHCGTTMSHYITLIGYGEDKGMKYWLGKNSWGTNWGENGYIRLQRETGIENGLCGLTTEPSYPTF